MKIKLNQSDIHLVGHHLATFVEPIFKGFEYKHSLNGIYQKFVYKRLLKKFGKAEEGYINLNKAEVEMLLRFLNWYTRQAKEFDKSNGDLSKDFQLIAESVKRQAI